MIILLNTSYTTSASPSVPLGAPKRGVERLLLQPSQLGAQQLRGREEQVEDLRRQEGRREVGQAELKSGFPKGGSLT